MTTGIYAHIPFCRAKCDYCTFYSIENAGRAAFDSYKAALLSCARGFGNITADTLYFGGGTPSIIGGKMLAEIIEALRTQFDINSAAEISAEINPEAPDDIFTVPAAAGLNRVSIGMQSAVESELRAVGRRHSHEDTRRTVAAARSAGIGNISLDIIVGLPGQDERSLARSIERAAALNATHVSCYMLSVEPGTPLSERSGFIPPDGDRLAGLYMFAAKMLIESGYAQYEISNFAKPGYECRHNLKYWKLKPYLGLGPAAHSFLHGRRFYYPPDISRFIQGGPPIEDDTKNSAAPAGSWQERLLLESRLNEGFDMAAAMPGFDKGLFLRRAKPLLDGGLAYLNGNRFCLTLEGMLLQNAIAAKLIFL